MIKVVNDLLPCEDFIATTIWPFIFVQRANERLFDDVAENHEEIHASQQVEMLVVGAILTLILSSFIGWWSVLALPIYYWWYIIEFMLRSIFGTGNAYRNISFEREAYMNEHDKDYLSKRKHFAWLKYMFNS